MAAYNEILLCFSDIFNVNIVSSRQLFYKSNCSLIFFPVIPSHNFQNRNSMKTRDICTKIRILCPGFLAYQDIYEKNVYYIPCVCHNRTFLPPFCPYVPFDFYKRTFLSSFCLYVLCRCHSRTFYLLFVHISHLTYAVGYFSSFFPYTSHLALLAVFLPETEMFRRWRSVYSLILIYINKKRLTTKL